MFEIFSKLYEIEALILWGGYAILAFIIFAETGLLAGFFLPGDSLLVTAGLMASGANAPLNAEILIPLLSAAAIAGDSVGYAFGFYLGPRLFKKEDSLFFHKKHLVSAQQFYEKHGVKTIVLARFIPIVRTFAPTVAGVGKMQYRTFLIYNVVGGIGWVAGMTLLGYFLGQCVPNIHRHLLWVVAVIIFLSFIPLLNGWRNNRRGARR